MGTNHDRTKIRGIQFLRNEDRSRTVGCTDDSDRSRVSEIKEERSDKESKEYTELSRRAEQHEPRIFEQRAEIDHSAYTDKQQKREKLI